jgi:FMN-dependent NADH-azoreductase
MTPLAAKSMFPGQHRKSLHLHACSPHNFLQEQELSVAYLRSVLSFLGVTDHETVLLEGDDPERVSEGDHEKARHRLMELAQRF